MEIKMFMINKNQHMINTNQKNANSLMRNAIALTERDANLSMNKETLKM